MKILFYTDSDYFSGAETVLLEVATGVQAEKKIVLNPQLREKVEQAGYGEPSIEYLASRSKVAFWLFWRFGRLIKNYRPDLCVINMQTPFANTWFLLAAAARRQRIVTIWHYPQERREISGLVAPLKLLAYRLAIKLSTKIVTVSQWHQGVLVREFGAPASRVVSIANGVKDPGETTHQSHQPLRFLVAGTLEERKGQRWLLELLQKVEGDWTLSLAGDGPDRAQLETRIAKNNWQDRVKLLGRQKSMQPLYREHDFLLHPAIAENLSMVIIEALSNGLPVVANNVGGNAEMVKDSRNGFIVPLYDQASWQSVLVKIIEQPTMIRELSQAARQTFLGNFTQDLMISNYQTLFKDVIDQN